MGERSPESPTSHPSKPKPGLPETPDIARDREVETKTHHPVTETRRKLEILTAEDAEGAEK